MTTPYKQLSLELKYKYIAKTRLLRTYKVLLDSHKNSGNTPIDAIVDRELQILIRLTQKELRSIHLVRAFIKGIPYRSVEPKCEILPTDLFYAEILYDYLNDIYKIRLSETRWSVIDEMNDWIYTNIPSKFFAKPMPIIGYDANGSPTV
jgi:hypothetical protein